MRSITVVIAAAVIYTIVLSGCSKGQFGVPRVAELPTPAKPGSTVPHLATSAGDTAVLSWLEPSTEHGHVLKFSKLAGQGKWSDPIVVSHGRNWFINWADFPSVVPIDDSLWAAHWLVKRPGGAYAYDVALTVSLDRGTTWSEPMTPHRDGTATEHGFVSLFPWDDGIGAVWLDGRAMTEGTPNPHHSEGATAEGAMSLRFGAIDREATLIAESRLDDRICDCCQTDAAMTKDGLAIVYRDRTPSEVRDVSVVRYRHGRWTNPISVAQDRWNVTACPVNGPAIASDGEQLVVAWFTAAAGRPRVQLARSQDGGETFGAPVLIDQGRTIGRVDVVLLSDGSAVVSWIAKGAGHDAEIRVRRVLRDDQVLPHHPIASTSAVRASGFPQLIAVREDLILAWTDPTVPVVRTARVTWK